MKIHFPTLGFNLSGGVRVIIRLASGLVKFGHEVRITVPAYRARPPFPLDPGVEVCVLGQAETSRLSYYRDLVREAAKWGDLLVASSTTTPLLLRRSIRKNHRDIPLVYLAQGYDPIEQGDLFDGPRWRGMLNRQIALRSYGLADHRMYISRGVAELVGLDAEPRVLRGGLDLSIYRLRDTPKPPRDRLKLGVIGRYSRRKGLHVFFEAWERLADLHDRVETLVWPTESGSRRTLPKGIQSFDVCGDEALAQFYQDLDLFVFPSLFEGLGLPPLEAMACGVPVVLTDCVGVREYAEPEGNCLMVPPGDAEALAAAIRRLVESSELREKLVVKGLETVQAFTWDNMVKECHEALCEIMK
jgi:glycosyltransferase involved in cell wall biosynthesis